MPTRRPRPTRSVAPPEPALSFCANCQVSVAAIELQRGAARRTPRGRVFCAICAQATPTERLGRRRALEAEFADDAPIPTRGGRAVRSASSQPAAAGPSLAQRVAHLEQVVLHLQARLQSVEQRES